MKNFKANSSVVKFLLACAVTANVVVSFSTAKGSEPGSPSTAQLNSPVYVLGTCRIRIADLFGGHFNIPDPAASPTHGMYYLPETGPTASPMLQSLGLECIGTVGENGLEGLMNVKRDGEHWLQQDSDDNWVPFEKEQHLHVVRLKGKNWTGLGFLTDQIIGDEERRTRHFKFCLRHDMEALCGDTPVALLSKPSSNELPRLKATLETIEFVDEGSTPPARKQ